MANRNVKLHERNQKLLKRCCRTIRYGWSSRFPSCCPTLPAMNGIAGRAKITPSRCPRFPLKSNQQYAQTLPGLYEYNEHSYLFFYSRPIIEAVASTGSQLTTEMLQSATEAHEKLACYQPGAS